MQKEKITIEVSPETAEALRGASPAERDELEAVIASWLQLRNREFDDATRELRDIMDEIGRNAERRGLTPAILDELFHDG